MFVSLILFATPSACRADVQRIYTVPNPSDAGGIEGRVDVVLGFAIALNHDRTRSYLGTLSEGGKAFRFSNLPTGKYDLVLLAKDRVAYEGLELGDAEFSTLPPQSLKNLEDRVEKSDKFYNRYKIHRVKLDADGVHAYGFIERIRDRNILKQSGEKLDANLRRFEVITFEKATDTWQLREARHLYREGEPIENAPPFFRDRFVPELGNLRIVDSVKALGSVKLPAH